jgi:putative transposase
MLMRLSSSVYYYRPKTDPNDAPIQDMLSSIAEHNRRWGFWKMYHYIRGQAHPWNHKRIYRIYTELCLNIRRKPKKRLPTRVKEPLTLPGLPNTVWSMDFMHDRLMNGRSFRTLNILDDFNREVINIVVDTSISSQRVARELSQIFEWRGKPKTIRVDNGPEFLALSEWCKDQGVELKFIQPAKPNQNAFIERFNRTFRDDVLGQYLFEDLEQVRDQTIKFIWKYNNIRPHDSLGNVTPRAFLLKYGKLTAAQADAEYPTFQQEVYDDNYYIQV